MARRHKRHEEHANHEAWAIPYGDLVTLLLAFFVVMYAISSVNAGKYRVVSDSLFAAFSGSPRTTEPIQIGERQVGTGADLQTTVIQQSALDSHAQSRLAPIPVQVGQPKSSADAPVAGALPPRAAAAAAALARVADEVEHSMDSLVKKNLVTVRRNDFWIEVEMRTDVLFPSGSAVLAPEAVGVIEKLGQVLCAFPNPIRVEGHTDNVPIKTAVFYSNWELSAARAGSVVRVLATHGVAPDRLAVIGYGEQRPLQPNTTAQGRNANRRVVVVILSTDLMRQSDPAQLPSPPPNPGAPAEAISKTAPAATSITTPNGPLSSSAMAQSEQAAPRSVQAVPGEPATPTALATPADLPTATAQPQPNTGTDRAP